MNIPLWFWNLLFWSAQVGLLVLAAGLLPRLFQIHQPRVLLAYWRALLLLCFALPCLQPWHHLPSTPAVLVAPGASNVTFLPSTMPVSTSWHFPSMEDIAQVIGIVILCGIVLRFALLMLGLLRLRRFREASTPITDSAESAAILDEMCVRVGASAEFRIAANVESPVTFGLAKPVILLPERFLTTDARFQSAIACHELLHIRRRDWAQHLVEEIVHAVLWFHPAVAWLISRVRLAREQVVDLEVVRLTNARKAYLEALLEFTDGRTRIAALPAPPFLVERQLVARVASMLKEVRMSRGKLIASLVVISCCLAAVVGLSAWSFPLKRAPLRPAPDTGVAGSMSGDVSSSVSTRASSDIPNVNYSSIWIDTVKRGPMLRQVRGLGKLVRAQGSTSFVAQVTLPSGMTADVKPGQNAVITTNKGPLSHGRVSSISPSKSGDTRIVDIAVDAVPEGTAADLEVDATIDIERIDNVLHVGRPAHGAQNSEIPLFKIVNNGADAVQVHAKLGRASANTVEVVDGLREGDRIILSDMSQFENADRIHLTDEQHDGKQ